MKPILFNTDMVRAIQDGTKTMTRRVVKGLFDPGGKPPSQPYHPGDILYVREMWAEVETVNGVPYYIYKANDKNGIFSSCNNFSRWCPSIYMPREAARIFLGVTDVRMERLQDMPDEDLVRDFGFCWEAIQAVGRDVLAKPLWDSTINPTGRALFGWEANPWVWVIEFERISKEEAMKIA